MGRQSTIEEAPVSEFFKVATPFLVEPLAILRDVSTQRAKVFNLTLQDLDFFDSHQS